MIFIINILLSIIGFAVSLYSLFIEKKIAKNPTYKPMCDISDRTSCSKPILSTYGKLFGISNAYLGLLFYTVIFLCTLFELINIIFILSIVGFVISLFLAYILYFKIRVLCMVCTIIYAVNGGLLLVNLLR